MTASRFSRTTSPISTAAPRMCGRYAASLGLEILALQPFRDFEGLPEPLRGRAFDRARRKFELMSRLGTKLLLVCSSVSPDAIDDMARVAADLQRARRAGPGARHHHRLRGPVLGPAHQRLPPGLGGGAAGGPPPCRPDPGHLPRARPQMPDRADRRHPGREDRPGADCRRARHRDGSAVPKPPLPLLPGPGRPAGGRDDAYDRGDRLCRPDQPRDLQRRVPCRVGAADRDRRHALVSLARRPARAARHPAAADGGRRVHRVRRRPPPFTGRSGRCCMPWAFAGPIAIAPRTSSCIDRAISTSCSTSRTRASPHSFQLLHGLSVAALALRVDDAAGALAPCDPMLAKPFSGPIGAGELEIPAVRGVGGSLLYFVGGEGEHAPFDQVDFVPDPAAGAAEFELLADRPSRPGGAADRVPELDPVLPSHPRPRSPRRGRTSTIPVA